jgi:hypothetical protein
MARRIWTMLRFPIHLPILIVSTREEQMFVPCPTPLSLPSAFSCFDRANFFLPLSCRPNIIEVFHPTYCTFKLITHINAHTYECPSHNLHFLTEHVPITSNPQAPLRNHTLPSQPQTNPPIHHRNRLQSPPSTLWRSSINEPVHTEHPPTKP